MQLKNISQHRPKGLIIDIAEQDAKALIKSGEFVELTKENLIVEKKQKVIEEKTDVIKEKKEKKII